MTIQSCSGSRGLRRRQRRPLCRSPPCSPSAIPALRRRDAGGATVEGTAVRRRCPAQRPRPDRPLLPGGSPPCGDRPRPRASSGRRPGHRGRGRDRRSRRSSATGSPGLAWWTACAGAPCTPRVTAPPKVPECRRSRVGSTGPGDQSAHSCARGGAFVALCAAVEAPDGAVEGSPARSHVVRAADLTGVAMGTVFIGWFLTVPDGACRRAGTSTICGEACAGH